jgi:hypothetical protein
MLPKPVASPSLRIDDAEVELSSIWIHSQDAPYPGGHRYRLWLPEALGNSWRAGIGGLYGLGSTLASAEAHRMQGGGPALFVLNTIDTVSDREGGVEIEGECSPHCSSLHCPSCGATVWANWLFNFCARGTEAELRFRCDACSNVSNVTFEGERVSLASLDGTHVSTSRQSALKYALCNGVLTVRLGKLTWNL